MFIRPLSQTVSTCAVTSRQCVSLPASSFRAIHDSIQFPEPNSGKTAGKALLELLDTFSAVQTQKETGNITKCRKNVNGKSMNPKRDRLPRLPKLPQLSKQPGEVIAIRRVPHEAFEPLIETQTVQRMRIPKLSNGLRKVLSRPGVHWLKDPDTQTYNFPSHLEDIPRVEDFDFQKLHGFVPSSQDHALFREAKRSKCKFIGSTSSLKGMLVQIYLLLSQERMVNLENLSEEFNDAPRYFTPGQRSPASVVLRQRKGVYATDVDKEREGDRDEIILLSLGTLLEKFLTLPETEFMKLTKASKARNLPNTRDVHRYARHGQFLMRSQLDCVSDKLPGSGVFDLKTRAISQIRHDVYNYSAYSDMSLDTIGGRRGSFEEEYYDMIRAAFLEYSFQARIGNMSGIFVAYHNVARIFGFQYISLEEIDLCLFGREGAGERVFSRCVHLLEVLYKEIIKCLPENCATTKCTFEKRGLCLRVWIEPVMDAEQPSEVIELALSLKHFSRGDKEISGKSAVYNTYPWAIEYRIERSTHSQEEILARRARAHARQERIAESLPGGRGEAKDAAAIAEAISRVAQNPEVTLD